MAICNERNIKTEAVMALLVGKPVYWQNDAFASFLPVASQAN
ncbi:hypothetical protein [Leptolyngbya sp. NK1-12]|nr:hypothetical protein [Leptolyngbya sp. NK1-12]